MKKIACGLLVFGAALSGCGEQGAGQVQGTLFIRGCVQQGTLDPKGMPAMLPAFDLLPGFFAAESLRSIRPDQDPRGMDRLLVQLRRSGHRADRTDSLTFVFTDVPGLKSKVGTEVQLTVPPITSDTQPLPTDTGPRVGASLALTGTCLSPHVAPTLSGTLLIEELGFALGETVAGRFNLTIRDLRGEREKIPKEDQSAAGQLSGWFRFPIQPGRSITFPP